MWQPLPNYEDVLSELEGATDRAFGVIAGAILESHLERSIANRLKPLTHKQRDFFKPTGPMGAFGPKIDLGYLMGIYGDEAMADFHNVAKVRNRFAHTLKPLSFDHNEIASLCRNLTACDRMTVHAINPGEPFFNLAAGDLDAPALGFFLIDRKLRLSLADKPQMLASHKRRFETTVQVLTYALRLFNHPGSYDPPF